MMMGWFQSFFLTNQSFVVQYVFFITTNSFSYRETSDTSMNDECDEGEAGKSKVMKENKLIVSLKLCLVVVIMSDFL